MYSRYLAAVWRGYGAESYQTCAGQGASVTWVVWATSRDIVGDAFDVFGVMRKVSVPYAHLACL